jgi:hypothetical protein
MPVSISGTNGVTFPDSSLQAAAASPFGLKNRIINGDMRIDQRNAGAAINPATDGSYCVDRWQLVSAQTGKYSVQQNAGSVTPPVGFKNYLGATSLSAYTVISTDSFALQQKIEGFNIADLNWGTANAVTVTLSFWVRSSLTGTFGGALSTDGYARAYPFAYTISAANTWEQKSVTIAGDTSGTWATNNTEGIRVAFSLGAGSARSGTAGAWAASPFTNATGATSVVGTNGATFYITGVQLELGSTATPFERRMYGQELALCQRYYYKNLNSSGGSRNMFILQAYNTTSGFGKMFDFPVQMRATPSINTSGTFTGSTANSGSAGAGTFSDVRATTNFVEVNGFTGLSGLTAGNASVVIASNNAFVELSAEL